ERPSERSAGPERPSERSAGPERPSERSAGPERPSERSAGPEVAGGGDGQPPRPRRRGSRGGRGGGRSAGSGAVDPGGKGPARGPVNAEGAVGATGGPTPARGRGAAARRGTVTTPDGPGSDGVRLDLPDLPDRLGEGRPSAEAGDRATVRRPRIGDTRPAPADDGAFSSEESADGRAGDEGGDRGEDGAGARRRRRRGGRGRGSGQAGPLDDVNGHEEPVALDEETLERRRGRERKGRPVGRYFMCVHSRPDATQIAVLEGRSLIEHYVARPADDATQIHGNIYLGRVQNVLPGMEAAFVDIGTPKNAVLYRGDVQYDPEDVEATGPKGKGQDPSAARIENLLKVGQTVLCQVTKNPIGTKGARLTQEVSLAGRFMVLLPGSTTYGISKRLADDERKRLRRILDEVRSEGNGLIVRTAAEGATPEELRRDVERLQRQWAQIEEKSKRKGAPALLYREPPLAVRVIREEFNKDYRGVVIDDPALHGEVHDYVAALIPELADRIELYDDPTLPLFERQHIHEQLHKALDRKVWLPSGGSLIIERTEALTVIDVNTGKNVGTSSLEETVFRNNLEAAVEIAHQLRLRDIGGIIVIDFIDMEIRKNRDQVLREFKEALSRDKTRTQVFEISELGLVEMTRKRVSEGLVESFSTTCPTCAGRGFILDEALL
ncbi:MAG: Rne/Rng family ribonuclease, partial [Acidimicrobiales bacterium]